MEQEQEKNKILSEALETLATEHHELERSLVEGSPPRSILSEDEFYDALSGNASILPSVLLAIGSPAPRCLWRVDVI